jgi:hypothetical protein
VAAAATPKDETSDLAAVEAMLRAARGGDRTGSVRAITLNLIVHAPEPELIEGAIGALEHVGPSHPLRAIVATPADGELRATVASSCWVGASDRQVCSERVVVEAAPKALPSAVTSLLVPDLPVFLVAGAVRSHRPAGRRAGRPCIARHRRLRRLQPRGRGRRPSARPVGGGPGLGGAASVA